MRLIIDMQGAQGASRSRGIGRYSLLFAKALVRNRGAHEVILVLNGLLANTIEPIRAAFDGILPQANILVWDAPGPVHQGDLVNEERWRLAEQIRETFLASLNPDRIHICSLFEGFGDNTVASIGKLRNTIPTSVTLYDLIPFIYRDIYLEDPVLESWYMRKIGNLRRADLLLSISASSGQEAVKYLGVDAKAVIPVGSDCDAQFTPRPITDDQRNYLRSSYGIERPFVMYTGGIDRRKNIERLIGAYATLPQSLREAYQLVLVCAMQAFEMRQIQHLVREVGLGDGEVVLTGYVSEDDLVSLYNASTLFVFPSWHEGFGLPVLEAMRCGKAVIGSNTASLPEVIGREDALFDPFDIRAISYKMEQVLTNRAFRIDLERHALQKSIEFDWNETAKRAWKAFEGSWRYQDTRGFPTYRLRLAHIGPLPPERTGVADYSAELIFELTRWYQIDVIVKDKDTEMSDRYVRANCRVRSVEEFKRDAYSYDRILYHMGNSTFHAHIFSLIDDYPGVVVLHDFFLSNIQAHREMHGMAPNSWVYALYRSHGYHAVQQRYESPDGSAVGWHYPANLGVLQAAQGIIVHSEHSRALAQKWYGKDAAIDWTVIPLLRRPAVQVTRGMARVGLGLGEDDLLICSFGMTGPTKLSHRLLDAWFASPLSHNPRAYLVFVGQNDDGDYGRALLRTISAKGAMDRIRITGWANADTFRHYLAAVDIGVQLRTLSRGEISGAALDCMNYGVATVVNAHGGMKDIDPTAVWRLPDEFQDNDLVDALTALAGDKDRRRALGARAQEIIHTRHAPRACAEKYVRAIESYYQGGECRLPGLVRALATQAPSKREWPELAASLARNFPPSPRRPQLLVDVSELAQGDAKTGIQRVVRTILSEWLQKPPGDYQVEPVYAGTDRLGYRYARRWTSRFLGIPDSWSEDMPVEAWAGDLFVGLDMHPNVVETQEGFLREWRNRGVGVWFVVYDLLPVMLPEFFPDGFHDKHQLWLKIISDFDGVACISRTTADHMAQWVAALGPHRERPLNISWFHLGAEVGNDARGPDASRDFARMLEKLRNRFGFLMVGTIEPRKGHAQVLQAMELLWQRRVDVSLTIVGKQGWMVDALINKIRGHAEYGKRLFWLDGAGDEYLESVYAASACLIAASYGEGFGLPLVEAALHDLPIIARDIPVFREVAGANAYYFSDDREPETIARAITQWLALSKAGQAPQSRDIPYLKWRESAQQLAAALGIHISVAH